MGQDRVRPVVGSDGANREQRGERDTFCGTWNLVSCMAQWSDGRVTHPYGENAAGILMYGRSGYFAGQIMRPHRPAFGSGDMLKGTPGEIKAAYEGYLAYYGTYEIDTAEGTLIHHVRGSLFPNWIGLAQTRFYEITDRTLRLTTPPILGRRSQLRVSLVWDRMELNKPG